MRNGGVPAGESERPTTPESDDVSRMVRRTSAAPLSEAMLFASYRIAPFDERACECGGWILADRLCPGIDVAEHNASARHQLWRRDEDRG